MFGLLRGIINRMKLIFAVLMLVISAQSVASTVLKVDFNNVVNAAELVFQGQVISKEVRSLPNGQPMTFITFSIDDLIKGSYTSTTIELGFLGGETGGRTMIISDLTMPEAGEEGIYFVENTTRRQVNPLYGWHQGHYLVKTDSSGNKTVEKLISDAEYSPNNKSTSSYQAQSVTNNLDDFKSRIDDILNQ